MPPPIARVVQVEVVSEYPNGHDVPLSSGSGGGGGPAPSVNPTEAEAAVQADRGPLPDKTNEAIRLKWQEIEVKPGGQLVAVTGLRWVWLARADCVGFRRPTGGQGHSRSRRKGENHQKMNSVCQNVSQVLLRLGPLYIVRLLV